jgi:hypothetical protein
VGADGMVRRPLTDPFLVIRDGRLVTANGVSILVVPYRLV